MTWVD
ncbi:hypothetical protein CP10743SC13_2359A, partial [Chlamydia psittaci 10_743_SC13]